MAAISLYQIHALVIFRIYEKGMLQMWFALLGLLLLASCNTPGPHFRDVPATRVRVNGSIFDVRVRDELAEGMRINPEYAPRFGPIKARAAFAIEAATGCQVLKVLGDQALVTAVLDCGDSTRPKGRRLPSGCVMADPAPNRIHDPPLLDLTCISDS